jgi:hypothetical protein
MLRTSVLLAGLLCAACAQPPPSPREIPVAHARRADLEREVAAADRLPIVSDDGREIGRVRSYLLDREGRIIGMRPADRRLEPADAPVSRLPLA